MAVSPTPPLITPMPPAPLPTDAEAVFDAKAGASLTAQTVNVTETNTALTWTAGAMAETKEARDAAALSAIAAAQSVTDAEHQVDLAATQVGLAEDQVALAGDQVELADAARIGAEVARDSAEVFAAASQSAIGAPALTGNSRKVLSVKPDETGVEWVVSVAHLHAVDERPSGSLPGTVVGAYSKRVINTVKSNTIAGATLSNSEISLPAGKYKISASAPLYGTGSHKCRLYNATSSQVMAVGTTERLNSTADDVQTRSFVVAIVELLTPAVFYLEHRSDGTIQGGRAASYGDAETYSTVLVERFG